MSRGRGPRGPVNGPLPVANRISQVRFNLNWQWPAISMQYERLMERSRLPMERLAFEHMRTVADMDFLVTAVRRLLRTAGLARQIPSTHQEQLDRALRIFHSKWGNLTAVRNALEHSDTTGDFPVPAIGIPTSGQGDGEFTFMWSGGNIDLGKLYANAQSVAQAIAAVLESAEAGRAEAKAS